MGNENHEASIASSLFGDRVVQILGEAVRGARCVALEPGGLDETGTLLESLSTDRE